MHRIWFKEIILCPFRAQQFYKHLHQRRCLWLRYVRLFSLFIKSEVFLKREMYSNPMHRIWFKEIILCPFRAQQFYKHLYQRRCLWLRYVRLFSLFIKSEVFPKRKMYSNPMHRIWFKEIILCPFRAQQFYKHLNQRRCLWLRYVRLFSLFIKSEVFPEREMYSNPMHRIWFKEIVSCPFRAQQFYKHSYQRRCLWLRYIRLFSLFIKSEVFPEREMYSNPMHRIWFKEIVSCPFRAQQFYKHLHQRRCLWLRYVRLFSLFIKSEVFPEREMYSNPMHRIWFKEIVSCPFRAQQFYKHSYQRRCLWLRYIRLFSLFIKSEVFPEREMYSNPMHRIGNKRICIVFP